MRLFTKSLNSLISIQENRVNSRIYPCMDTKNWSLAGFILTQEENFVNIFFKFWENLYYCLTPTIPMCGAGGIILWALFFKVSDLMVTIGQVKRDPRHGPPIILRSAKKYWSRRGIITIIAIVLFPTSLIFALQQCHLSSIILCTERIY